MVYKNFHFIKGFFCRLRGNENIILGLRNSTDCAGYNRLETGVKVGVKDSKRDGEASQYRHLSGKNLRGLRTENVNLIGHTET